MMMSNRIRKTEMEYVYEHDEYVFEHDEELFSLSRELSRDSLDLWKLEDESLRAEVSMEAKKFILYLFSLKVLSVREQVLLMRSGSSKHPVHFSWVVLCSSLMYMFPAITYFVNEVHSLGAVFCAVTVTSAFADSIASHSRIAKCIDRVMATVATLVSPVRVALFAADPNLRSQIILLLFLSLSCLGWSRQSTCMKEFRTRHTVWHVTSSAALTFLAWRCSALG